MSLASDLIENSASVEGPAEICPMTNEWIAKVGISDTAIVPVGAILAQDVRVDAGAILTASVVVEAGVEIGPGVVFSGRGALRTVVRTGCRIGAGAVIAEGIELGRG